MTSNHITEGERRKLLKDDGWIKTPSVSQGGKPFFWVRFSPDPKGGRCREAIVWDRYAATWKRRFQVAGEW